MIPYFDAHCDTIFRSDYCKTPLLVKNPEGHLDLERLERSFSPRAQFFALFDLPETEQEESVRRQYQLFQDTLEEHPDRLLHCRTGQEARQAFAQGKTAAFLSVEGAELLGCSLEGLKRAYDLGVRSINLTWNQDNALAGAVSDEEGVGLSPLGKSFVEKMQELGILVDVSHLSDAAFWDVMELAKKPIIASHSNARAICSHPRNLSDAQFLALVETGGVAGLNLYVHFLGENPDFDTIYAHLSHFWNLGGEDHVCLGGDWDGCDTLAKGFEAGVSGLSELYDYLQRKHCSQTLLDKLYFKNLMRVVDTVCIM